MYSKTLLLIAVIQSLAFLPSARGDSGNSSGGAGVTVQEVGSCSNALPWNKRSEVRAVERVGSELIVSVFANTACSGLRSDLPRVDV